MDAEKTLADRIARQIAETHDRSVQDALTEMWRKEEGWVQLEGPMPLGLARLPHPLKPRTILFSEDDAFGRRWSRPATPAEAIEFLTEEDE